MKKLLCLIPLLIMLFAGLVWAGEKSLEFSWDQVISSDFAGWKLYMSETPGDYTGVAPIDIPYTGQSTYESTQVIISPDGETHIYYFVLTAYDDEMPSLESGYSNEVSQEIDFEAPGEPFSLTVTVVTE